MDSSSVQNEVSDTVDPAESLESITEKDTEIKPNTMDGNGNFLQRPERPSAPLPRIPQYVQHLDDKLEETACSFKPISEGNTPAGNAIEENRCEDAFIKPRIFTRGNRRLQKPISSQNLILATLGPVFAYDRPMPSPTFANQALPPSVSDTSCQEKPLSEKRPSQL